MNLIEKIKLYVISLWLLFLLIIVIYLDIPYCYGQGCEFIGFKELINVKFVAVSVSLIFIVLGYIFYLSFLKKIDEAKDLPSEILECENYSYEHLTFLTTYIIPIISFNLDNDRNVYAIAILLFSIGLIYIKTDKFYANPTLAAIGFKLFKIKIRNRVGEDKEIVLIIKGEAKKGDYVKLLYFDEKIAYGKI